MDRVHTCTMQKKVQVSTAAVVSWPAMSMVIKSSRSCLFVASSPRMSTRKRSRDGSLTCWMGEGRGAR